MNLILSLATLTSVAIVHGQSSDKGMIPFPRVGRPDRFYMDGKRDGNSLSPGLIPFPRIGRSEGIHEGKRQLIPFPRVGKRPFWHLPVDQYLVDYEEFAYPASEVGNTDPNVLRPGFRGVSALTDPSGNALEDNDTEKRNGNNNNGMWFGPRLGKRRKRSIETDTSAEHSRDSLDTRTLLKILHNFNWAIVPIKESRTQRYSHSSEEVGVHRRSPPYIPRLGRSKEVASAEVGLEDEVHTARFSKNDNAEHRKSGQSTPESTNVNGGTPFSTRSGSDHLTSRLVHSGED